MKKVPKRFGSLTIFLYLYDKKNRNILKYQAFQLLIKLIHIFLKKNGNFLCGITIFLYLTIVKRNKLNN